LLGQKFEFKNIDGTDTYVIDHDSLVLKNGNLIIFELQQNADRANMDKGGLRICEKIFKTS
jgi:hypothetical protein